MAGTINLLDRIRGVLRRDTNTAAQLTEALATARQGEVEAVGAVERQTAAIAAGFLDPSDKRDLDRQILANLRGAAEDASLLRMELERRLNEAQAADEEARKLAAWHSANGKAHTVAKSIPAAYGAIVKQTLALLREIAEADAAVMAANAALPAGAAPLQTADFMARSTPWLAALTEDDGQIELWGYVDGVAVADNRQDEVDDFGEGVGVLRTTRFMGGDSTTEGEKVVRRKFRRIKVYADAPGKTPSSLAATISLPALYEEAKVWGTAYDYAGTIDRVDAAERAHAETSVKPVQPKKSARPFTVRLEPVWTDAEQTKFATPQPSPYHRTESRRADAPRPA